MKKVFATLAATGMLGATCVGFAACGGDTDNGGETNNFELADSFTSDQVDEETIVAAADRKNFENVLIEAKLIREEKSGDAYALGGVNIKILVDGSKVHIVCHAFGDELVAASYIFQEGEYCGSLGNATYFREDETTLWKVASEEMLDYPHEFLSDFLSEFVHHLPYMQYSFNAEKKGYYLEMGGTSETLKFKDGKLYSSNVIVKSQEEGDEYYNAVYTYGGQSVTLPEVAE